MRYWNGRGLNVKYRLIRIELFNRMEENDGFIVAKMAWKDII